MYVRMPHLPPVKNPSSAPAPFAPHRWPFVWPYPPGAFWTGGGLAHTPGAGVPSFPHSHLALGVDRSSKYCCVYIVSGIQCLGDMIWLWNTTRLVDGTLGPSHPNTVTSLIFGIMKPQLGRCNLNCSCWPFRTPAGIEESVDVFPLSTRKCPIEWWISTLW